ncbi:hypothetical protein LINGRAHAP2_LOCUS24782, partial [Linum grandiflorum]
MCMFYGHNSMTCPRRLGVQLLVMNIQDRNVVARKVRIATRGTWMSHFPET